MRENRFERKKQRVVRREKRYLNLKDQRRTCDGVRERLEMKYLKKKKRIYEFLNKIESTID